MPAEDETASPPAKKIVERPRGAAVRIQKMTVFVDNALLPEIQARIASQGYGPARLAQGRALRDDAQAGLERHLVLSAEAKRGTDALYAAWKALRLCFSMLVDAAWATLRERKDLLDALGLRPRKAPDKSFPVFVNRARSAYETALGSPEIQGLLAARGYDPARLALERTALYDLMALNDAQEAAKGQAQASTHDLRASMEAMGRWYGDAVAMARRALRDRRDLLDVLGIKARSATR